jgi:membrane-associated protease RseP (regulator of RpoE activity)
MDPALEPYMSRREFDDAFAELSRQLHKELDGCGDFPISLVFWLITIVTFVCGGFILFFFAVISARTVAMGIHGRVIGPLCEKAGLTYMVNPAKPPDGYGGGGTLGIVRFFLPAGAPVAGAPTVGDGIHLQTAAEAMERVVTTIVKGDGGLLGITLTRTLAAGARGQHGAGRKIEVTSISAGSPTEAAGLHVGDVLVEIEGRPAPQTAQECIERLQAARAQCTVTVERQRSTNPAMPVAVAVPIPAPVAAVPVAGSTMTLPDKVARIKRALDLDEALLLPTRDTHIDMHTFVHARCSRLAPSVRGTAAPWRVVRRSGWLSSACLPAVPCDAATRYRPSIAVAGHLHLVVEDSASR